MYFRDESVDNYDYEDQPHEIAARAAEESLYEQYMTKDKLSHSTSQGGV